MNVADELAGHAFISYVHENSREIDRLQRALEAAGIRVWRDTADLWPGQNWQARIRSAITNNALVFIACFSRESIARRSSYQHEELALAVEEMRKRPPEEPWLISVRLDDCDIPDWDIGGGRTLKTIQWPDLFGERLDEHMSRLVTAVLEILRQDQSLFRTEASLSSGETSAVTAAAIRDPHDDLELPDEIAPFAEAAGNALELSGIPGEPSAARKASAVSVPNVDTGHAGSDQSRQHWEPALTPKEATKVGIPSHDYESAVLFARMAVKEHQRLGTRRDRWEPTFVQNDQMADRFITDGEQKLAGRLEVEADPALDKAQDLIESAKANLDEATKDARPIAAPEAGTHYSVAEAVTRVEQHDRKIEHDRAVGKYHHDRASVLLKRLATAAPWLEAVGFLTFVSYYLNVPLFQPWQDWFGWSFSATVVMVIILGQTWLVRHAAQDHNHAREARADGNRFEAGWESTRRNRYIALTAVTAAAITSGMIWRGIAALGNATVGTTAAVAFLAIVTGLLLPTLAYLGVALDGSKVSRERDGLAADLDDDLDAYLETISNSRRDLAGVAETSDRLKYKTFPDICNTTQEAVDAIYSFYAIVRLLIGGLSADPPSKTTTETPDMDAEGNIRGDIGTSIPGSRKVDLKPLFDRRNRLTEIEKQRKDLLERIEALPPHPWGRSRAD
jgi:hypothetical protein